MSEIRTPWWWGRKWWWPLFYWWFDQTPPFGVCLDCGATGLTSQKFYSLMAGRVEGHPLTGAGTCVECSSHDRDGVTQVRYEPINEDHKDHPEDYEPCNEDHKAHLHDRDVVNR